MAASLTYKFAGNSYLIAQLYSYVFPEAWIATCKDIYTSYKYREWYLFTYLNEKQIVFMGRHELS